MSKLKIDEKYEEWDRISEIKKNALIHLKEKDIVPALKNFHEGHKMYADIEIEKLRKAGLNRIKIMSKLKE